MRALLVLLVACGGADAVRQGAPAPVAEELAMSGEIGVVVADADMFVFAKDAVHILHDGKAGATTGAPRVGPWTAAARFVGPDGESWAVGIAGGILWRVTASGEIERVHERLGLGEERAVSIAAAGSTFVIGLEDGVAMSRDGLHLVRLAGRKARVVASAYDRVAFVDGATISVVELRRETRTSFSLEDVTSLAFIDPSGPAPRLAATVDDAVYVEDEQGVLRRTEIGDAPLRLASAGERLWILGDGRLYSLASQTLQRHALRATGSRLFAANDADIWLASKGQLTRLDDPTSTSVAWSAIEPVFARACSACHEPGGPGGLDLSVPAAWQRHRSRIARVLHTGVMPPPDHPLQDADRDLLLRELLK